MQLREEAWHYIEAVEAEVEIIHRSHETIELAADGANTLPVQAFVCGIRKEEEFRFFFALHSKSGKRNLIYSVLPGHTGKNAQDAALKAALEIGRALGFSMEGVNLKCSTALREVVIRNVPVLLAPNLAQKAVAQRKEMLANLERLALEPESDETTEEAVGGLSPARRAARERARLERLEEIRAAAKKLAAENVVDEREAATRHAVRRCLAPMFEAAGSKKASAAADLVPKAAAAAVPSPPAGPAAPLPAAAAPPGEAVVTAAPPPVAEAQEMQRLTGELERLLAEKSAVEQRFSDLLASARQAAEEAERERAERGRLEEEKASAEKRAQELAEATRQAELRADVERAQRERLNAEKAAAEKRAADLAAAAETAESRARVWQEEQQRQLDRQARQVQAEREQLLAAKTAAEQQAQAMAEAVRSAEQRAEHERGEREALLAGKAAAEQRARELAAAVQQVEAQATTRRTEKEQQALALADRERAERERLAAEKLAAERRAAELADAVQRAERQSAVERAERERLHTEKAAAERRAAELAQAARRAGELAEIARQAAMRAENERRERERLEAEKARIESRLQLQPVPAHPQEPVLSEPGRRRSSLPSLGGLFANGGKGAPASSAAPSTQSTARPAVTGAFFQVEPDLPVIFCESADAVLEIHQAISMTQLSLEGFPNQYCMAYIVGLQQGSGRQVHVAFRLTSSNRVLVYSPLQPPQDQPAYAKALQEASRFLRVAGIEIERVPLGNSPQSRARALEQIPVLRLMSTQAPAS